MSELSIITTITNGISQKISRNRQLTSNVNPFRYDAITFEAATSYTPSAWINAPWLISMVANDSRNAEYGGDVVEGCRPDKLIRILDAKKKYDARIEPLYNRLVRNTHHWLQDLMEVDEEGIQQPPCIVWRQMYPQTQLGRVVHFWNDPTRLILRGWKLDKTGTMGCATLEYEDGTAFLMAINLWAHGTDSHRLSTGLVRYQGNNHSIVFHLPGFNPQYPTIDCAC